MKLFIVLVLCGLVAMAFAEPQRQRNSRYRKRYFARQELAPADTPVVEDVATAPYLPSGWKPEGEPFEIPSETTQPSQEYGPPANEYGAPEQTLLQPGSEYLTPENQFAPAEQTEEEDEEEELATEPESETFAPLATEEESGRYRTRSRYVARSRQYNLQRLRALPKRYRKAAPAKLRKRF